MDPNRTDSEDEEDDVSVSTEPVVVGQKRALPKGIFQMGSKLRIQKATLRRESRSGTALRR